MAIKLAKKNNVFNMQQRTFYIDDETDLDAIEAEYDCGIGDIAECPDGTIYRRHSDGYDGELWVKKGSSGGGGGGSGLPEVAIADVGKTMVVQKVKTGDTVIVPEQTVTTTGMATPVILSDVDIERFVDGAILNVTLNDTECVVQVAPEDSTLVISIGGNLGVNAYAGIEEGGSDMFFVADSGEYTISITAPDYASADWATVPAGLVIHITNVGTQMNPEYQLDKTYLEIMSAIEAGIIPIAIQSDTNVPTAYNIYPVSGYGNAYGTYVVQIDGTEYSCFSMDDFPLNAGEV